MTFVPVAATPHLRWSRMETRERDYAAFCQETGRGWRRPDFATGADHPVVNVSPDAAMAFCRWLEVRDSAAGLLVANESYRLPTDAEWSFAAGLSGETGSLPATRHLSMRGHWAWGKDPHCEGVTGNYPDEAWHEAFQPMAWLRGVDDGFACTAPVGSFKADGPELHDLFGNVSEWVMSEGGSHIARGGSWHALLGVPVIELLERSYRHVITAGTLSPVLDFVGFRVVLARGEADDSDDPGKALRRAALAGDKARVERLLQDGAPIDAVDTAGNAALHLAAERGHPEVCKVLLARGADLRAKGEGGYRPLDVALGFSDLGAGVAEAARLLIAAGAPLDGAPGGDLPLVIAVRHAPVDIVATLLEKGAYPKDAADAGSVMAMLGARRFDAAGHAEILTLLKKQGGDLKLAGRQGLNAMFAACAASPTREHLAWLIGQGMSARAASGSKLSPADICGLRAVESDQAAEAFLHLLENGARCSEGIVAVLAWNGLSRLAVAAAAGTDFAKMAEDAGEAMGQAEGASSSALGVIAALGDAELLAMAAAKGLSAKPARPGAADSGLFMALDAGRADLVEMLLRAGVSLAPDGSGDSPMVHACRAPGTTLRSSSSTAVPLHSVSAHFRRNSAKADRLRCVRLLLEAGVAADGATGAGHDRGRNDRSDSGGGNAGPSSAGESPLACAARADRTDLMELLLRAGAKVDARDASGFTPLITAAEFGAKDAMRLLLERGADVHALSDEGRNALIVAASEGHANCVDLLLAHGATMNRPAGEGRRVTPQEAAAWNGRVAILRRFSAGGVRLKEDTRLMAAAAIGASTRRQLAAKAVSVSPPAALSDYLAVLGFLAEQGVSPNAPHPEYGRPLLAACNRRIVSKDTPAIIDKLLAIGADVNASDPLAALHEAVQVSPFVVRQLLENGADPDILSAVTVSAAPGHRIRPLHAAAETGREDTAAILLEHGAAVDAPDGLEQSALFVAAGHGKLGMVSFLIKAGARVDQRNGFKEQATAMHAAASNGHVEVIRTLVEAGADPTIGAGHPLRSPELMGTTARQLAEKNGHRDAAELLGRLEREWKARSGSKGAGSSPRPRPSRPK